MKSKFKLAHWLLKNVVRSELHEELLGDLQEIFQERSSTKSKWYARILYWFDVFHLMIGFAAFPKFKKINWTIMLGHYTLVAGRNISKNKLYAIINILGLSIGMAVCLLIAQYVYFELSYDRFHQNHQNIYRVIVEDSNSEEKETYPDGLGYSFGVMAKSTIPEVEQFVRKERVNRVAAVSNPDNNRVFHEDVNDLFFVDESFFKVFGFELLKGNPESLFDQHYNIVITEETALKYFGTVDPIGKQLEINGPPSPGSYRVTGIVKSPPKNSHLQFDMLMPFANYINFGWGGAVQKQGGWGFSVVTYLTLSPSSTPEIVENKLNQLIAKFDAGKGIHDDIVKKVFLQPVADVYLKSSDLTYPGFIRATGNINRILVFAIIAGFILIIAWINFINLSNAQSVQRAKEVGIRKSLGAFKKQLISQFLFEAVAINVLAAIMAIGLTYVLMPTLNQLVGKQIDALLFQQPKFWLLFLTLVFLGSLLAGLYPAFILSGFRPIKVLKGNRSKKGTYFNTQKGLIIFQFVTSLLLISGTYLIYKQVSFLKKKDLGLDLEKILIIQGPLLVDEKEKALTNYQTFRKEIVGFNAVEAVSGCWKKPGQYAVLPFRRPSTPSSNSPHIRGFYTSLNFSNTFSLEFIAGENFTPQMIGSDVTIINESAVKSFGFISPEEAVGAKLMRKVTPVTVVGVVKDFHWHSLHEGHMPYVIDLHEDRIHEFILLRINTANIKKTISDIKANYMKFFPGNPFKFEFADESFNSEYQSENQFSRVFMCFSLLAVVIGCIGLFALVSQSLTTRIKEIGIRKVLGARSSGLFYLLTKEYLALLLLSTLIAIPIALIIGEKWLDNFAHRIQLGPDLFLFPFMIVLLFTTLTVAKRTISTVNTNPVDSLKSE